MKYLDREVQSTFCAISTVSSLTNKTGSWRFGKPVFVDRDSPCSRQCPAGVDIPGFMHLAAQERFEDAWRLIVKENPFPAIMGRVCYHTCEGKCNRRDHDQAVSINLVERFLGDYALENNFNIDVETPGTGRHVSVIGAGPSGLSTAYHLRLKGHSVGVYDVFDSPGGLLRYGIPAYRLPKNIVEGEIKRLRRMGIQFHLGAGPDRGISWEEVDRTSDAVIMCLGAHRESAPEIPGAETDGVYRALDFLKRVNEGERPHTGKQVVVIGGGNSAVDCARVSRRLGAEVTIVYRRGREEMPAYEEEIHAALQEGVRLLLLAAPAEIYGSEQVTGIRLMKMKLGDPDESGRRRPLPSGETLDLACGTVILALGEGIRAEDLPPIISLDGRHVRTDDMGRTGIPGYFACGDMIDQPHTVTHAVGSGKRVAVAVDMLLQGKQESIGRPVREVVEYRGLNPFYFDRRPRVQGLSVPLSRRLDDFRETTLPLSQDQAVEEARRCFVCGRCTQCGNCFIFCPECSIKLSDDGCGYRIDLDYCKGCGICVQECPRGAMNMEFPE